MTTPKRALPNRYQRLWLLLAVLLLIMVGVLVGRNAGGAKAASAPVPAPTATWTTYVPRTSKVCRDAADLAKRVSDEVILYGEASWSAVEKLRTAKTLADVKEARKQNEAARRAAKNLDRSQPALAELVNKCENT